MPAKKIITETKKELEKPIITIKTKEEDKIEAITIVKENKVRQKSRNEIDKNQEVCCRSVTTGLLQYKSEKTGAFIVWSDFGSEQWVAVDELIYMNSSKPKFLQNPWMIIESEEIVKYLGLQKLYETIIDVDNLEDFFRLPLKEVKEKLLKIPSSFKENVAVKARQMMTEGILYDMRIIKILEETLHVDLQIVLDME